MREREANPERVKGVQLGIYNETDTLKIAAIWGAPSVEAVLAQLYPPEISLFYGDIDVLKARQESQRFTSTLQGKGVKVIQVRDELAKLLPKTDLDKRAVLSRLFRKAEDIQQAHRIARAGYKDVIVELIEQDVARYGEEQAVAINTAFCLDIDLPMGNLIYARDQMNVLLDTRFQSTMAKSIRKPEVKVYEQFYQQTLGLPKPATMPEGETFEGGDAYIHDGVVYVGVGARTTLGAALHIFKSLRPQLQEAGFQFVIVEDRDATSRPEKEQMDFMHLDTFSMPFGKGQVVVCEEEAVRRKVSQVVYRNGEVDLIDTGKCFADFLLYQEQEVKTVPLEEQQSFGCNLLVLDNETVLVPLEINQLINTQLTNAGKKVELMDLRESTNGYGGPHCMTGQLFRSKI